MRGIAVKQFGGPEVLEVSENLEIPEPNDNQIQIRVHAVGVNPIDTYIRGGLHEKKPNLPYTPGFDCAGVVTKLGGNVKGFQIGDRVFTITSVSGTYAEYTVSESINVFPLPDNLSFEEGSALGFFLRAKAKPGETVLVHGASGATGIATVQIAKACGLNVIGTAGTSDGIELVKGLGTDFTFNHRESDYVEKIKAQFPTGIDIIVEMAAHSNFNTDLQLLKPKLGRLVIVGNRSPAEVDARFIMIKEITVTGVLLLISTKEEYEESNTHLQRLIKLNAIKPILGRVYPLEEASKAQHDVIYNSGTTGRLTIKID